MHGAADTTGSWMLFGGGLMWLFWILLIVLVVVVVKAIGNSNDKTQPTAENPLDILRKRYARGEIDEEEFERKRRELEQ